MEERKIATRLTPKVKEFIREKFGSDIYEKGCYDKYNFFHYPNFYNFKGFTDYKHVADKVVKDYTEVTEQEFLDYFKVEFTPKIGDYVQVSDNGKDWLKRIYLNNIIGAESPFIVVISGHEEMYLNGDKFNHVEYKYMKPLRKQITKEEAEKLLDADIID